MLHKRYATLVQRIDRQHVAVTSESGFYIV